MVDASAAVVVEAETLLDPEANTVPGDALLHVSGYDFGKHDAERGSKRSPPMTVASSSGSGSRPGPPCPRRTFDETYNTNTVVESERPSLQCNVAGTMSSAQVPLGVI